MRCRKFYISRFLICFIIMLIRRLVVFPIRSLLSRCLTDPELHDDATNPQWSKTKLEILLINGKLPEKPIDQVPDYSHFQSIIDCSVVELVNLFRICSRKYFNKYQELQKLLASQTNIRLKRWRDTVDRFFTLLFGLINCESGQIFKVIFGTSSARIHKLPALTMPIH